jgi:hypothetical protein
MGPYYPFHSKSSVHTIQCTRMRAGVELCHSPPRRFSQPVVHNRKSPLVSYAFYVCVRVAGLYSTRGILKLDSRSQGKRRRTEEKAHSHQNHVSYSITRWVYIQTLVGCHGWMWVLGFLSGANFSRVSLKKVAFGSLALSQTTCFISSAAVLVSGSSVIVPMHGLGTCVRRRSAADIYNPAQIRGSWPPGWMSI